MNPDNNFPQNDNTNNGQPEPQQQSNQPMPVMPTMPTMPVMPAAQQSSPSIEFQQIQSKTGVAKKKLSKKQLILIIVVVVSVVGLGLFLMFSRPNYGDVYRKADIANDNLKEFYEKSREVSKLVTTDTDEFATKLEQEKAIYKKFQQSYKDVEGSSALNDKEIKDKFTAFKAQADLVVTKMNAYFETALPLHEFAIKSKKLSSDGAWTDEQINDLTSSLTSSKNSKLVDFGEEFATASKKLVKAASDYKLSKKPADYSVFLKAKSEYTSIYQGASKLSDKLGVMTSEDSDKLSDTWRDFTSVVTAKYKESIKK